MACIRMSTVILLAFFCFCTTLSQVKGCRSDSECSSSKHCCKKNSFFGGDCHYSCVGRSCDSDSDCAPDECCDSVTDKCKTSDCDHIAGWIVAVIVISIIVVIVIPIVVVIFCCCCAAGAAAASRRPVHGGVIVAAPAATTVVATNQAQQMQFQNPQPYPNQPPPYHPQGSEYPPGAYVHPMAMAPPSTENNKY